MSESDSGSSSGSSNTDDSGDTQAAQPIQTNAKTTKIIPPLVERKLKLRNQLDIYQVDEEYEEEKHTVTDKTATDDVMLPNIRESKRGSNRAKGPIFSLSKQNAPRQTQLGPPVFTLSNSGQNASRSMQPRQLPLAQTIASKPVSLSPLQIRQPAALVTLTQQSSIK